MDLDKAKRGSFKAVVEEVLRYYPRAEVVATRLRDLKGKDAISVDEIIQLEEAIVDLEEFTRATRLLTEQLAVISGLKEAVARKKYAMANFQLEIPGMKSY